MEEDQEREAFLRQFLHTHKHTCPSQRSFLRFTSPLENMHGTAEQGRASGAIVRNLPRRQATDGEALKSSKQFKTCGGVNQKKKPTPTKGHGMWTTLKHKHT